jgi:hypothetical protein
MADPRQPRPTGAGADAGDHPPYPGMPRWVKVSGIIVIALALLIALILATGVGGDHGPGRHGGGGDTPHSGIAGQATTGGPDSLTPSPSPVFRSALVRLP